MIDTVLFDLDGTLSDSAPGILGALRASFAEAGLGWVDPDTARSLLGPPFWHSLPPLVGEERVEAVVEAYRRHYVTDGAMFDTTCYDGVLEVLQDLTGRGYRLAVATSKPEPHASEIVAHLGLAGFFVTIGGDTLDGARDSKALVVGEVLRRLGEPDPARVLMVGDRSHDVLGAAAHGLACAGALWGYGTAAELTAAGAVRLCAKPAEVLELLPRPDAG
ncbi:HAD hydrolase-like protein [Jatrophihabitans sp.]|uniref:HAD hydrolase-like protein n=1 Tax=Jatrophihabitans sp. TaxID=1932789 RepID=UPI002BDE3B79|nr:HAD hydrolase-like protein [Jatrophihabitans sp.]